MKILFALLSLPLLYWSQGIETAPNIKQAGIEQFAVPPENVDAWRDAGFKVVAMPRNELEGRERLLSPGIQRKYNVASPTRAPWIDANGWRFLRAPTGQYLYDIAVGKAALAAAESFVYNADTVVKLEPGDLAPFGQMLTFLRALPTGELPTIADFTVIDTGTTASGEVMNLLMRRNLLFQLEKFPSSLHRINIKLGTRDYPESIAADPSAFAQKIRQQLGDENRSLRIYGSEVVIARLMSDSTKLRLHLLNYGGREIEGLRIRLRGKFASGSAMVAGIGRVSLQDFLVENKVTEFTLPKMASYALIELPSTK
jgi:hypothetical protein